MGDCQCKTFRHAVRTNFRVLNGVENEICAVVKNVDFVSMAEARFSAPNAPLGIFVRQVGMKTQAGCTVPETDQRLKNTQHCEVVLQNFAH